jgi:hypothetical protein
LYFFSFLCVNTEYRTVFSPYDCPSFRSESLKFVGGTLKPQEEFNMNRKLILAMLAGLLALSLAFVGCDNGTTSSGGDDGDKTGDDGDTTQYTLEWGAWDGQTYATISSNFTAAQHPLTPAGSNAGYLTGSMALSAYNIVHDAYRFDDGGTVSGSFDSLLNFSKDGIGLPDGGLKNALREQKANVPLAGVFQYTSGGRPGVSVFYLTKK